MATAGPASPKSVRIFQAAVICLTGALAGLHLWLIVHAGAFCGDEVNVLNLADTHSLSKMTRDSFPVLFPLVVLGWKTIGLGGSDLAMRLLGLAIGMGVAWVLWLPVWIAKRETPLFSVILFGLNGIALYWTDYLRAYGLGSLLIVLTVGAMCWLLTKPGWGRAAVLAAAAVLSVQTLYQNAVFFAAIGLGGWVICWFRRDWACALKILAAALIAAASLVPYLGPISRWQHTTTIRPGFSMMAALDNLETVLGFPSPQFRWLWVVLSVAVVVFGLRIILRPRQMAAGADHAKMTSAECSAFAAVVLIASVSGYYFFLHFAGLITSPWYFVPLMAVAAVCFDISISVRNLAGLARTVLLSVLVATAGLSIPFAIRDLNCRFSNMDIAVSRLEAECSPQDYVLVTPWYLGISFSHYSHGMVNWDSLPPVADHSTYRFDLVPVSSIELARLTQPVLDRAADTLKAGHRVWVLGWMTVPAAHRRASTELGRLLAEHSLVFAPVDLKIAGQTSDYENVVLVQASGWRTNAP